MVGPGVPRLGQGCLGGMSPKSLPWVDSKGAAAPSLNPWLVADPTFDPGAPGGNFDSKNRAGRKLGPLLSRACDTVSIRQRTFAGLLGELEFDPPQVHHGGSNGSGTARRGFPVKILRRWQSEEESHCHKCGGSTREMLEIEVQLKKAKRLRWYSDGQGRMAFPSGVR